MKYTYQQIMAMGKWEQYDAIESMTQAERDAMNATVPKNTLVDVADKVEVTPVVPAEEDCKPVEPIKKNTKGRWLSR